MRKLLIVAATCLITAALVKAVTFESSMDEPGFVSGDQWDSAVTKLGQDIFDIYTNLELPILMKSEQISTLLDNFKKSPDYTKTGGAYCYFINKRTVDRLVPDAIEQAKELVASLKTLQQKNDLKEIKDKQEMLDFHLKLTVPAWKGIKEADPLEQLLKDLLKKATA